MVTFIDYLKIAFLISVAQHSRLSRFSGWGKPVNQQKSQFFILFWIQKAILPYQTENIILRLKKHNSKCHIYLLLNR
jgi:hypothetical protein